MLSLGGGSFSNTQSKVNLNVSDNFKNIEIESNQFIKEAVIDSSQTIVDIANQAANQVETETVDLDKLSTSTEPSTLEDKWMFGEEAKSTIQYGGDQGRLNQEFKMYGNDPKIMEIINKYYQNVDKEDLELLFAKMDDVGCGYMAAVDTLFAEFSSRSPEEFKKIFGFDPTIDKKHKKLDKTVTFYNYDYLFLDFFLYSAKRNGFSTIEEVYGNIDTIIKLKKQKKDITIEETGMEGTYESDVAVMFDDYLKERGIDLSVTIGGDNQVLDNQTINKFLGNGTKIVIGGEDFSLYSASDDNNNGLLDDIKIRDVPPHTMYLVGTTDDPTKVVVSSWGEEYIMDISDITDFVVYDYNW